MSTREYASHRDVKNPNILCVGFRNINWGLECSLPARPAVAATQSINPIHKADARDTLQLCMPKLQCHMLGMETQKKLIIMKCKSQVIKMIIEPCKADALTNLSFARLSDGSAPVRKPLPLRATN